MDSSISLKDINVNEVSLFIKILKGETNLTLMAKDLGITLQGVRYYITTMKEKGFLEDFKITPKGYEYLSSVMKLLKGFVVEGTDIIFKSTDWECISDNNFKVGEIVYLHMDGGFLHACKKNKNNEAEAIAVESAKAGNKLRIRDIKGIININFGTVWIETIENLNENNSEIIRDRIIKLVETERENFRIFVMGEGAYSILSSEIDVNIFAPLAGAFDCANRGLDSKIYTTAESLNLNFEEFSALKEKFPNVKTNLTTFKI